MPATGSLLAGLVAERRGNAAEAQRQRERAVQFAGSDGSNWTSGQPNPQPNGR